MEGAMPFDFDVIIVGAGVAGALCADKLAHHPGARILLIDPGVKGRGVGEIQPEAPDLPANYNTAAHAMGTLRMGTDGTKSVVNSYGLSHEHKNLYVVGSSVFVTAATANPTLTIAALALRTAEEIEKRL
jgi:choline dehydrogenase-like flavoprotein